jgi:hypothetical protein
MWRSGGGDYYALRREDWALCSINEKKMYNYKVLWAPASGGGLARALFHAKNTTSVRIYPALEMGYTSRRQMGVGARPAPSRFL